MNFNWPFNFHCVFLESVSGGNMVSLNFGFLLSISFADLTAALLVLCSLISWKLCIPAKPSSTTLSLSHEIRTRCRRIRKLRLDVFQDSNSDLSIHNTWSALKPHISGSQNSTTSAFSFNFRTSSDSNCANLFTSL